MLREESEIILHIARIPWKLSSVSEHNNYENDSNCRRQLRRSVYSVSRNAHNAPRLEREQSNKAVSIAAAAA